MSLLVRTWNLFHGNASPPERHGFLEQMIRLATEDGPDVLCLQELPVWALSASAIGAGCRSSARSPRGRCFEASRSAG